MSANHKRADVEILEALHKELTDALLRKVRSGEATAADLAVARQFLKDNNIDAIPNEGNGLGKLASELPFQDDEPEAAGE